MTMYTHVHLTGGPVGKATITINTINLYILISMVLSCSPGCSSLNSILTDGLVHKLLSLL